MSLPRHRNVDTTSVNGEEPYIEAKPYKNPSEEAPSSPSSDNKEAAYYPNDVEAAGPLSDQDSEEGRFGRKLKDMRRSKAAIVARDMFLILLLLGWWIPGIVREVSTALARILAVLRCRKPDTIGWSLPSGPGSSSCSSWCVQSTTSFTGLISAPQLQVHPPSTLRPSHLCRLDHLHRKPMEHCSPSNPDGSRLARRRCPSCRFRFRYRTYRFIALQMASSVHLRSDRHVRWSLPLLGSTKERQG